jgi:hypothetical protein
MVAFSSCCILLWHLCPSHLRRSLPRHPSVAYRQRACRWPRHGRWGACPVAPQVFLGWAKGTHERVRCWWCTSPAARRRIPPRWLKSTGPGLPFPYVANVCFKCIRCFRGMLQLLHMDVAKVDRDVAHFTYFCKCFPLYVASILKKYFIYFRHMLQQVFYLDVTYILHKCCNSMYQMFHLCPTHVASKRFMLQVFHGGTLRDGCTVRAPGDGCKVLDS